MPAGAAASVSHGVTDALRLASHHVASAVATAKLDRTQTLRKLDIAIRLSVRRKASAERRKLSRVTLFCNAGVAPALDRIWGQAFGQPERW